MMEKSPEKPGFMSQETWDSLQSERSDEHVRHTFPPKPDFMSQEAWDGLMQATRSIEQVRDMSQAAIDGIRNGDSEYDDAVGLPVLLITAIGRKSGKPRTSPANYVDDGDKVYVVGSIAGHDRHPMWVLNIEANNNIEVEIAGRDKFSVVARKITGTEREDLWPVLVGHFPLWGHFQKHCDREFMVFEIPVK